MKKIDAIIRHHKLDDVKNALANLGVHGMTVTEVRGMGRAGQVTESYRGQVYSVDLTPRMKVELVVSDEQYPKIMQTLMTAARTGQVGDGRIIVTRIEDVVRVRTGETGEEAL
ncbi:MAG TPA: P-II family nitrogen regulator [Planctomycetaceae bacterium]|jgi:nitrogen regulatory protein P-II 1|nr:P-II family nitrogen regulator [Planctomycetaceae bacterium]